MRRLRLGCAPILWKRSCRRPERVLERQVEHAHLACLEAEHLAAGAEGERHILDQPRLADLGPAGDAGDAERSRWSMKYSTAGSSAASRSASVMICGARPRAHASLPPLPMRAMRLVVGAVEFLVGLLDGGRAALFVGGEELLQRGGPAAVGAGAGLGQGGGRRSR